nr:MMPL family transporter [Lentzea sp. HUAS12]
MARPSAPAGRSRLARLGVFAFRRPWLVLGLWVLVLAGVPVSATVGLGLHGSGLSTQYSVGSGDAQKATELLRERFPARAGDGGQIVLSAEVGLAQTDVRQTIERGLAAVRAASPEVVGVSSPYGETDGQVADAGQTSPDGRIGFASVQFGQRASALPDGTGEKIKSAFGDAVRGSGVTVEYVGQMFVDSGPPPYAELVGIAVALVVLLSLGSIVALSVPLLVALFGVGTGITLVLFYLSRQVLVPDFAAQVVSFLAIGISIDYALLIVHRYRGELGRGHEPLEAVQAAMSTAGRATVFSALTVVGSLAGMLVVGMEFINGLAVAAMVAVLICLAATLTLVPALISLFGRKARPLPPDSAQGNRWRRLSTSIQRSPRVAAVLAVGVLLILAAPALSIRLGQVDASNESESSAGRRAYDLLASGFGPGSTGPLTVVVDLTRGGGDLDAVRTLAERSAELTGVVRVSEVTPNRSVDADAAFFRITPAFSQQDERTAELVAKVRAGVMADFTRTTGSPVHLGGQTARGIDLAATLQDRLLWLVGGVLLASMIMLTVLFRSALVPLKAAAMNLLSIGAAFGVVVAVFQLGWGAELIGVGRPGPVLAFAPVLIFSIAFGVSMDYEVFLLERMRESYLETGDNTAAVTEGVAGTGRVVTSCALIMVAVFAALVSGDALPAKIIGLGLAAAVAIDATIVRMILVPATMQLLGHANWWPAGRRGRSAAGAAGRACPQPQL